MNTPKEKWCKFDLTYSFRNFNPNLPIKKQKEATRGAFDIWEKETKFTFTLNEDLNILSDIEIIWKEFSSGLYGCANFPTEDCKYDPEAGNIFLNLNKEWTWEERDTAAEPIDLMTLTAHEIGHSIGIHHRAGMWAVLMNAGYEGSFRRLDEWDKAAYRYVYEGGSLPDGYLIGAGDNSCSKEFKK